MMINAITQEIKSVSFCVVQKPSSSGALSSLLSTILSGVDSTGFNSGYLS